MEYHCLIGFKMLTVCSPCWPTSTSARNNGSSTTDLLLCSQSLFCALDTLKIGVYPSSSGQEKQMTNLSRVDKRPHMETEEIKMAGKHRKGNQYAEVGKHLGMNAKHPHLGSKPSVNTDGYFSLQQLNEAVPLGVSHVITHEHRVLRAQSFPDLAPFTAVQQSTAPAVIPHFYHFLLSSNVWSLLHSQTTGRERSCSYKCAELPS